MNKAQAHFQVEQWLHLAGFNSVPPNRAVSTYEPEDSWTNSLSLQDWLGAQVWSAKGEFLLQQGGKQFFDAWLKEGDYPVLVWRSTGFEGWGKDRHGHVLRFALDDAQTHHEESSAPHFADQEDIGVFVFVPAQPDSHGKSPFKRLLGLYALERNDISLLYFFALLGGIMNLLIPLGVQGIIGLISGGLFLESVVVLVAGVIFATSLIGWLQIQQLSIVERIQQKIFAKTAFDFTFRLPRLKLEALANAYAPELMNRFFEVISIQKSLPKILIDLTGALLQIAFGLILLAFYHPYFLFLGILLLLVILAIIWLTGPKGLQTSLDESKSKYKLVFWLEEMARSIHTFKLAGISHLPLQKTDDGVSHYLAARQAHFKVLKTQYVVFILFKVIVTAALLLLGGFLVINRQINLGQFVASEIIILLILSSVEKLNSTIEVVYDLLTSLEKIGQITNLPLEDEHPDKLIDNSNNAYHIEFRDVAFAYPGSDRFKLKGISFDLKPGNRLGVCGQVSSGKTTLIRLVTALYSTYQGAIIVNDQALRTINLRHFRSRIGENLSHHDIFHGTILENITIGKADISIEKVWETVHQVGLLPFIQEQPKGLHTMMNPGGRDLAQSTRDKIILARSFCEDPAFVVLDDFLANSPAVDRNEIMTLLFSNANAFSMMVVSNRPDVLQKCDQILWLDQGHQKALGTWSELSANAEFQNILNT